MAKNDSSKTILIIAAVVAGILLVGGLIIGASYWVFKASTTNTSTAPSPVDNTKVQTQDWLPYTNDRFGFSMRYPTAPFEVTESQNGDGITLTGDTPAVTIRAYGSNNVQNQILNEYLSFVQDNLFKENPGAEEIASQETTLGGIAAQKRKWQYNNSLDGSKTVLEQATALKDDKFYSVEIVIDTADYAKYAPTFDEILSSYKIK